jgi:hypothetical protein
MASSSKKRTTMAKHNRENKVREKQALKAAKKAARKRDAELAASQPALDPDAIESQDALEPQDAPS